MEEYTAYMERECKSTCGFCQPPIIIVPEVEPVPQPNNDNCLPNEMNRILDYSYEYDDYPDEACASVQDYPIAIKSQKYSTYDAQGSCKVSHFH